MAGGFGRGGLPLHARSRSAGAATAPSAPEPPPCPVKHCWVTGPVDGGRPRPGLLLEWRKDGSERWEGRVTYAAELRPGRWATVEEWLPAALLSTA
jgi:hypothetical protein